nr:immunoglobulin heavy chain junction region [Macaca mulatta]MOW93478.1 immunoglobulin heavy chain junction region [Macaca mulatta]MOW93546.1 immunoglobulin heavy chain junction region [Macaca mulatta]MOW93691.1 immunoglobulin heavy chain junction region [Macaca mulatta]MOW95913.1 immunoglobulin heavy chain junction region [Macaca mulatta]
CASEAGALASATTNYW